MSLNEPDVATLRARHAIRLMATPAPPPSLTFSSSRWPYTYACDQARARHGIGSRAEASVFLRDLADRAGMPREFVAEMLATAYCTENNIEIPSQR